MLLLISPHPLICERGELYHLLHVCQQFELVGAVELEAEHFYITIMNCKLLIIL